MARVRALKCRTCKAIQGDRHKWCTPVPTKEVLDAWMTSGQAEATDGCPCEPDGLCQHGHYSWLVSLGKVQPNPKARPKKVVRLKPAARKGHLAGGTKSGQLKGDVMKTSVKKEKSAGLVAGMFRAKNSLAHLYTLLADGKPHSQGEVNKVLAASGLKKTLFPNRTRDLRKIGKETGKWVLETLEDGRYKLKLRSGKGAAAQTPKAKLKPNGAEVETPKKSKVGKQKPIPSSKTRPTVQDEAE